MSIIWLFSHSNPKDHPHPPISWSFRLVWADFLVYFYKQITIICKNVLLAVAGSTFLKSGPQHFTSKKPFFGPPSGKKMKQFGHFRPHTIFKIRWKNEYNLFMDPPKPEGPPKLVLPVWLSGPSGLFWPFFIDFSREFVKMCFSLKGRHIFEKRATAFYIKKTIFRTP